MRILIVDDDEDFCNSAAEIAEEAGHEVVCAYSEQQATDILKAEAQQFDVALIDMKLHGDDQGGLKLIEMIADDGLSVVPIVVTGYGEVENAVESMKAGAFDYIQKGGLGQVELIRFAIDRASKVHQARVQVHKATEILEAAKDITSRLRRVLEVLVDVQDIQDDLRRISDELPRQETVGEGRRGEE